MTTAELPQSPPFNLSRSIAAEVQSAIIDELGLPAATTVEQIGPDENSETQLLVHLPQEFAPFTLLSVVDKQVPVGITSVAQRIQSALQPLQGTFQLRWNPGMSTSAAIEYNASAYRVESAIESLETGLDVEVTRECDVGGCLWAVRYLDHPLADVDVRSNTPLISLLDAGLSGINVVSNVATSSVERSNEIQRITANSSFWLQFPNSWFVSGRPPWTNTTATFPANVTREALQEEIDLLFPPSQRGRIKVEHVASGSWDVVCELCEGDVEQLSVFGEDVVVIAMRTGNTVGTRWKRYTWYPCAVHRRFMCSCYFWAYSCGCE